MPATNAIRELMNGVANARRRSEVELRRRPRAMKGEEKSMIQAMLANAALALV
jgi:hypothetical protein